MELTEQNYFSKDADMEYISVSQIKKFISTPFNPFPCEVSALAEIRREVVKPKSNALMLGSWVDAMLTGTKEEADKVIADNPEMISSRGTTKGQLKSEFAHGYKMVERVKKDPYMMKMLDGEHQVIMKGQLFGVPTKVKFDVVGKNYIADLKTCESISKTYFDPSTRQRVNFIGFMDYVLQGAIYTEIYRQNTGRTLPFYIVAVSKEAEPDIEVAEIDFQSLHERLFGNEELGIPSMEETIRHIHNLKNGDVEPIACGVCDYCKARKKITKPVNWMNVGVDL